jgi:mannose-6-phosphate isomerase-like protein (cupin superfamily)
VEKVNLAETLASFDEMFSPRIVAAYNENKVCVVKLMGEFVWHSHLETDDLFLVLSGRLLVDLPGGTAELGPGELLVVPLGVEHRTRADVETHVPLIEPKGTLNSGGAAAEPAPEIAN